MRNKIVDAEDPRSIERAAKILKNGGVVAFPTETVYGLGASALNPLAVARIFEIKKRPSFDPLIVHVASVEEALSLWQDPYKSSYPLMDHFWPGPLTLIMPRASVVPDIVTSGLTTVAVRIPRHPAALKLIRTFGGPIAAPSANLFGKTSPTTAHAVDEDMGGDVDLILDGGQTQVGVESTVIKIEENNAFLLRFGGTPVEEIEKFLPLVISDPMGEFPNPESPGQLKSHYAPRTPMFLLNDGLEKAVDALGKTRAEYLRCGKTLKAGILSLHRTQALRAFDAVEILSEKGDLREAAQNLFEFMRRLDRLNLDFIFAAPVPFYGLGNAIMDRLTRASSEEADCISFMQRVLIRTLK